MSLIKAAGAGEQSTGFYKLLLDQSLKFDDGSNTYLTRTPASAGNRKTFTYSSWVKRGKISADNPTWGMTVGTLNNSSNVRTEMRFNSSDQVGIGFNTGSWYESYTNAKFRDTSAWYHFVVSVDMTQSNASDRLKFYVNGVLQTFSAYSVPNQNTDLPINNTLQHAIGEYVAGESSASYQFDGYLAEINFIDGTALTAASFGETKDGIWIPKDTSGLTFGTNGFHLTFKDDVVSEGFNTVTWRGTAADNSISGLGFSPEFVWIKDRTDATAHYLFDVNRGALKDLYSNLTNAQYSASQTLKSFDADGFTVGNNTGVNGSADDMVAWCWEAGGTPTADNSAGAGATPTAGSVKIDGSNLGSALAGSIAAEKLTANTAQGFSIGIFTKGSGNETVAHGLGAAPDWLIVKRYTGGTGSWAVYHSGNTANPETDYLRLNSTNGTADDATFWGDTAPTSTVFTVGSAFNSGEKLLFYAWTDISGYSKFGSYTGSGSAGKQVTGLGFKPAWLMIKSTTVTGSNWAIWDNTRSVVDPRNDALVANGTDAEFADNSSFSVDFLSDGFELNSNYGDVNQSSATYIYMAFADTREAAFFKDVSTNGNHFTPVNLDYRDSVPDVPTNNFATLNALDLASGFTLSEGNLQIATSTSGARSSFGNFIPPSGKWYFEANVTVISAIASWANFGAAPEASLPSTDPQSSSGGISFQDSGRLFVNGSSTDDWIADWAVGDILQCAFDADTGKVWLGKNNTYGGSGNPASGSNETGTISGKIKPLFGQNSGDPRSTTLVYNFGQDSSFAGNHATANSNADGEGYGSFAYAPPSGFLALCSQNLPDVDIIDGTEHFNTVLYTGNGGTSQTVTGVGFSSDFIWIKGRSNTAWHRLQNTVGGINKVLFSNATNAEITDEVNGHVSSVSSDGFDLADPDGNGGGVNGSSVTYAAWNWLAGTAFSNDASATGVGTIDSSGQVNTEAGFSIIKYTGLGNTDQQTISVGLSWSGKDKLVIIKNRDASTNWLVNISLLAVNKVLRLNTTDNDSQVNSSGYITYETFGFRTYNGSNMLNLANDYIAYCFHSVEGYSKVGSYTGNGNADGTFVYTGFRPAWVMVKTSSLASQYWNIFDNVRDPFNDQNTQSLYPNVSDAEGTGNIDIDFLSNGMKMRDSGNNHNSSGHTYIYLAFAAQPFKFANAR